MYYGHHRSSNEFAESTARRRNSFPVFDDAPLGFAGGTTNLSEYVGNSPLNAIDPTGLEETAPIDFESSGFLQYERGRGEEADAAWATVRAINDMDLRISSLHRDAKWLQTHSLGQQIDGFFNFLILRTPSSRIEAIESEIADLQKYRQKLEREFHLAGLDDLKVRTGWFNSDQRPIDIGQGLEHWRNIEYLSRVTDHVEPTGDEFNVAIVADLSRTLGKFATRKILGAIERGQIVGPSNIRGLVPQSGEAAELLSEYRHFRSQGFTPIQARYLTEPYPLTAKGHHFPITQETARDWGLADSIRDSQFNVLRPGGISRGRFYELHYMVDHSFHNANFPNWIGGQWTGSRLGLQRYEGLTRIWYATPGPLKAAGATGVVGGGAAVGYSIFGESDDN